MSKPFRFKQFTVAQDRSAMQVGTDGVLLGAWAPLDTTPESILDIGTGTGVIALMLAQRCDAQTIDALELDDAAYEQATDNFEDSPWGDRLFCYHAHLYEFVTEMDDTYDLIVCNPPFFENGQKTGDNARDQARFEEAMPFELLVSAAAKLLNPEGVFAVILPFSRKAEFLKLAAQVELFPFKITNVKGNAEKDFKRVLIAFSIKTKDMTEDELVIEKARHDYTDAYIALTQDFYLQM
ncbi:tRNA1(Val) (adenine(37)-N6)-methyltransferase [Flavimarina sp. Hel_I_48]|uniref:tRNA1(Val) (adenine(37)-N6)-methyltransferase n=1 Tax=Flavimarina sp. Hel_I_48 TaxID=1392488 RepID=UPI0004DF3EBC|nr:methyltransferase [Flavimarina sp. Hel_I_48]